ncbi:hypothetical protein GCM10023340_07510 [Nocardioides marinquilinus]|uniref:Uncharacterized protein n=1 Tax=Nocardioides marinquilinus TaxID=1210400 RepID=A0ABP9P9Q0_9ACTN
MNDTDLAARIDRSFGDGPAPQPPHTHLRAGRRALLRRRVATGAGALAVLAVVGAGVAISGLADDGGGSGTGPSGQEPGPAAAPDQAPAVPTVPPLDVRRADLGPGGLVAVDRDGTLVLAPGVRVVEVVEDPLDSAPADPSAAVSVVRGDQERWSLVTSSGYEFSQPAEPGGSDFAAWAEQTAAELPGNSDADGADPDVGDLQQLRLVRFGDGETLRAEPGTTVLAQTDDVVLPESFAAPDDRTAAARVDHDGDLLFVLARQLDGSDPEFIVYPQTARTGATLTSFLSFAATKYEDGPGGGSEGLR